MLPLGDKDSADLVLPFLDLVEDVGDSKATADAATVRVSAGGER